MKTKYFTGAVLLLGTTATFAQTNEPVAISAAPSFFTSLATSYPWIATILIIIGALRVVFKPVMTLLDGYIKDNCSAEEYAKLQSFEAGPIYKWASFALDFVGSIKLPVIGVKPSTDGK